MSKAGYIALVLVVLTGVAIFYTAITHRQQRRVPHLDVERSEFPIKGIDISAHNGNVDFEAVAADSVDFVYLKASEGNTFRDGSFADNYDKARAAGLPVGAYHFFRFECDGEAQARNMLQAVSYRRFQLPLAIDVEETGNGAGFDAEAVRVEVQKMMEYLRQSGYRVMVYTNKQGLAQYVPEVRGDSELWICSFTNPPLPGVEWTLWQHSHRGRVRGVEGMVDVNTFNGDRARWRKWVL
ncbi:MAG: hypothetical protein K2M79_00150 [Muribaculaceae bacterium]|nr:hypothetical protein [Muribaculaceae bacterium]